MDGVTTSVSEVTARQHNFSQHFRTPNLPIGEIRVAIPRALFVEFYGALEPGFQEWVAAELQQVGNTDDVPEFVMKLERRSWPPADQVVAEDALLNEILRFAELDLAVAFFGQASSVPVKWVLNSIDDIAFTPGLAILTGAVGRADLRTAFQDY